MDVIKKFLRSFKYCAAGIVTCIRTERNFRAHIVAALLVLHISLLYNFSNLQYICLLLTISAVLVAEIINTAVEALVDLATETIHGLAKIAKDVAAGAVGITAIFSIIIAYFLFIRGIDFAGIISSASTNWWIRFAIIFILGIIAILMPTERRRSL